MRQEKITGPDAAMASLAAVSDPIIALINATANDPAGDTVESLRAKLEAATAEQSAYKRKVAEVMTTYAKRHDLCALADQALAEVGLRRVKDDGFTATATLTITWSQASNVRKDDKGTALALLRAARELVDFDGSVDEANSYLARSTFDGHADISIDVLTAEYTPMDSDPNGHLLPAEDSDSTPF